MRARCSTSTISGRSTARSRRGCSSDPPPRSQQTERLCCRGPRRTCRSSWPVHCASSCPDDPTPFPSTRSSVPPSNGVLEDGWYNSPCVQFAPGAHFHTARSCSRLAAGPRGLGAAEHTARAGGRVRLGCLHKQKQKPDRAARAARAFACVEQFSRCGLPRPARTTRHVCHTSAHVKLYAWACKLCSKAVVPCQHPRS